MAWLDDLYRDVRHAGRALRRTPGFAAVVVLTLALGIGATAAIYSVLKGVLLQPLPFPDADRVVVVNEISRAAPPTSVATGKYIEWGKLAASFDGMGALAGQSYNLTSVGEPIHVLGGRITASLLSTMRIAPALGRNFLPEEELPYGQENCAILSHRLWLDRFDGSPGVLDRTIQLNGRPFTIVGVMPPETGLSDKLQIFTPLGFSEQDRANYGSPFLHVIGRLKAGYSADQAQSEMGVMVENRAKARGAPSPKRAGWGVRVTPIMEAMVGNARPVLLSLLGAVGFLLLTASANVTSLLLARATVRQREMAVRVSLGASRGRIIRQMLAESLLLSLLGGALGLLLAKGGLAALIALAPDAVPRATMISVDLRVLGVTAAIVLFTGIAVGMMPGIWSARAEVVDGLKSGGRGTTGHERIRSILVAGEVAIAFVLLVGAGLLMRSFVRLQEVNPGFNARDAHVAEIFLPRPQYGANAQYVAFAERTMAEIASGPGIEAVGVSNDLPFSNHHFTWSTLVRLNVPGRPPPTDGSITAAYGSHVSPDYFRAMGIPLLSGRPFDRRDVAGTPATVVISEGVARALFPGEHAVGKSIRYFNGPPREVVGVVGDVKQSSLNGRAGLQVYQAFLQAPDNDIIFVVRAKGSAGNLAAPAVIRQAIARADSQVPLYNARPLAAILGNSIARQQFSMTVFAIFSGVALVLAAIGIYGMVAYSVSRRTAEIGIRMALGATTGSVLRLIFAQGGRLVAAGLLAGIVGAVLLTGFLEKMLYGLSPHDPLTFATLAVLLGTVGSIACLLPARRAAKTSPMTALRAD